MRRTSVIALLAIVLLVGTAFAQTRTGILTGRVSDDQGEFLPGVTVTISSPSLIGGERSTICNERGQYRFIDLAPGIYVMRAELQGFQTSAQADIRVRLGLTTTVNVELALGAMSESVDVVAETPAVDVESNKLAVNYDKSLLTKLPSSRSVTTLLGLTPGVVVDVGQDASYPELASFGSGSRENYYSVDGTYLTDPGAGSPMIKWNYDIIEEAQVEGSGHEAQYGNSAGAVINVVTKSGGDTFSGLANFYFRNASMRADNMEGTGLEAPTNAIKREMEGSLNFGGPIVKEKVWFFLSGGYIPTDSETVGFTEDIERRQKFAFGKVTAQAGPQHRFSLVYNYSGDITNHMFASQFRTPDSTLESEQWTSAFNLQWNYQISGNALLEMRGAYVDRATTYVSNGPGPMYYELTTGMQTESAGFHNEQTRRRYQFQTAFSYWLEGLGGDHDIKSGVEYEQGESGYDGHMQYDEPGGPSFVYTMNGEPLQSVVYDPADVLSRNIFRAMAFYAQDTWKMGNRLSLNYGFRINNVRSIIPEQDKVPSPITEFEFTNLEPRIGAALDLSTGSRQMVIKAHWGRYFSNTVALGLLNPNSLASTVYVYVGGVPYPVSSSSALAADVDPDLKRPYSDAVNVGFEISLSKDLAFKVNGILKNTHDFVGEIDSNRTAEWWEPVAVDNPVTGGTLTVYNLKSDAPANFTYYTNPAEADRTYKALQFILEKSLSHNFQFMLSYTMSRAEGMVPLGVWGSSGMQASGTWNDPNMFVNSRGVLDLDKPHSFKFNGVWTAPLGFIVGVNYVGQSGFPYARGFDVSLNQGTTTFPAEKPGAQRTPFQHLIDLRIEKNFTVGRFQPRLFAEAFNLLNSNTALGIGSVYGTSSYDQITAIISPRIFRLGIGLSF